MEIKFSVMAIFMPIFRKEVVSKSTLFGTKENTVPKFLDE